jgi:hypothetical protein
VEFCSVLVKISSLLRKFGKKILINENGGSGGGLQEWEKEGKVGLTFERCEFPTMIIRLWLC